MPGRLFYSFRKHLASRLIALGLVAFGRNLPCFGQAQGLPAQNPAAPSLPVLSPAPDLRGGAMLACSGMPCLQLRLSNGQSLRMLIDTGNANSILDKATAVRLGLELSPVSGADGKLLPNYAFATLKDTYAGDAPLGDIKVLVMDLKADIANGSMPEADGTLAYTAFRERLLMLDYQHQKFAISSPLKGDAPCSAFCGEITHPTFGKVGPPIVTTTGFTVNGKPVSMQIDTVWSGTMLIYDTSVAKLGLSQEALAGKKRSFPFTDGGVQMIEAQAATEGFGESVLRKNAALYFATPGVHQPDGMFDGTVGNELFEGHTLLLNFHRHQFSIL